MRRLPYFDFWILGSAFLTGLLLWWTQDVLPAGSAQMLYRARELASWQDVPFEQCWLWLLPHSETGAVLLMNALASLSLWLFCRIALHIGLGQITTLCLFLLLNFNPEYNDSRLNIELTQWMLPLHLLSILLFLKQKSFKKALLCWSLPLWLMAAFYPFLLLWNLLVPVLLLAYPLDGWRQRLQALLYYYLLAALLLSSGGLPFQEFVRETWLQAGEQFARASFEMSIFFSPDSSVELSRGEAYVLSLVLVLANAIKIAGPLVMALLLFSLWKRFRSVLSAPVRYFFTALLLSDLLAAAFWLMYSGYVFSDLVYMPLMMLALWLSGAGMFYLHHRRLKPQQQLLAFWLCIAYALASILLWGPSPQYLREAGEWARNQPARQLLSNSRQALFYGGANPNQPLFNIHFLPDYEWSAQDLILYRHSRKEALPEALELYRIEAEFSNAHGDKVYALRLRRDWVDAAP